MSHLMGLCPAIVVALAVQVLPPPSRLAAVQAPPGVLAEFQTRLDAYVAMHRQLERSLAPLPDQASQEQVRQAQQKLGALIREARPDAVQGNLLAPDIAAHLKRLFGVAFAGPDGRAMLDSIMDENPVSAVVAVNGEYPPDVPLSTMPPDMLAALPKLQEELEYRFVGTTLVILDSHADLIVDILPDALTTAPSTRPDD